MPRRYRPTEGTWTILKTNGLDEARRLCGESSYAGSVEGLRIFLCQYFSTGFCDNAQGNSIRPVGATPAGGKILKVRWALPGQGKSGSLRLAVVAYCEDLKVVVAEAFLRSDDPGDDEFAGAVQGLE